MESARSASLIMSSIEMCVMPKECTGGRLAFIVAVALSKPPRVEQDCKIGGGKRGKTDDRVIRELDIGGFNSCHYLVRGQTRKCDSKYVLANERPALTLK